MSVPVVRVVVDFELSPYEAAHAEAIAHGMVLSGEAATMATARDRAYARALARRTVGSGQARRCRRLLRAPWRHSL